MNRHGGSLFRSSVGFLGIISVLVGVASGQNVPVPNEVGDDLCGCSPGTYEFTFDFSLTCPPVNITRHGVAATFCQVSPLRDADEVNITDLVPVSSSIGISCPVLLRAL